MVKRSMYNHLTDLIYDLIEWIEKRLNFNISVDMVAKKSGYSKRYIQKIFKDTIGISIGEYIRIRRLTKSAMLVMFTKKKIEYISDELNFSSLQAFTRAFTSYFNCPPLSYRKKDSLDCSKLLINKSLKVGKVNQQILFNKIFTVSGEYIEHKESLIKDNLIRKRILRMKQIKKYKKNAINRYVYIISILKPYSNSSWDLNVTAMIGFSKDNGGVVLKFKKCVKIEYLGTWDRYPRISRNIFNIIDLNVYPYSIVEEVEFYCIKSDTIKINIYIEVK